MNRKLTSIFLVVLIIIAVGISGMWANELINGYNPDKYITIGQITPQDAVKGTPENITDEAVNKKIAEYMKTFSTEEEVSQNPQAGDIIVMDYTSVIDGITDNDVHQNDTKYVKGETFYLDGFDDQLSNGKVGEPFEIKCKFPNDETYAEYAGKDIVFTVTIKSITRQAVPELNDEYAKKIADVENVEQLKIRVKAMLEKKANQAVDLQYRSQLWDNLIKSTTVEYYPAREIKRCKKIYSSSYEAEAAQEGYTDVYEYISNAYNADKKTFDEYIQSQAQEYLKQEMIIKSMSKNNNIKVTDEYIQSQKEYYADYLSDDLTKYTPDDIVTSKYFGNEEIFLTQIKLDAVIDFVIGKQA